MRYDVPSSSPAHPLGPRCLAALAGVLVLAVGAAVLAPAALAHGPGTGLPDATLAALVTTSLDSWHLADTITVTVEEGTAVLAGRVRTEADRRRALKVAAEPRAIQRVEDRLTVLGVAWTDAEIDGILADRLEEAGLTSPEADLEIRVTGGVVALDGSLPTPVLRDILVREAERVPGVRKVVERLRIAGR